MQYLESCLESFSFWVIILKALEPIPQKACQAGTIPPFESIARNTSPRWSLFATTNPGPILKLVPMEVTPPQNSFRTITTNSWKT